MEKDYFLCTMEILNSDAFARLSDKAQVVSKILNEIFDTTHLTNRLTHSHLVSTVAKQIAKNINNTYNSNLINIGLLETVCLLHDIGHPPTGHLLEKSMNKMFEPLGIFFEGNSNNLVILEKSFSKMIKKYPEILLGVIKYPYKLGEHKKGLYPDFYEKYIPLLNEYKTKELYKAKKVGIEANRNTQEDERTFESLIMEKADDIAYLWHDFEDMEYIFEKQNIKYDISNITFKEISIYDHYLSNPKNFLENKYEILSLFVNNCELSKEGKVIDKDFDEKTQTSQLEIFKDNIRKVESELYYKFRDLQVDTNTNIEEAIILIVSLIYSNELIEKYVVSNTYKKLIKEATTEKEKIIHMLNNIAEMTDIWFINIYNTLKNEIKNNQEYRKSATKLAKKVSPEIITKKQDTKRTK
jgi:predicted deoxyguanosinetriphosphate triphosphohydrolase